MNLVFYISAVVAVAATLMTITRTNAIHALLYLLVSLFATALIFFILGAPFAAALEVIIYAGAIVVLFVFVVMMLDLGRAGAERESRWLRPRMWIGPSILAAILAAELVYALAAGDGGPVDRIVVDPEDVAAALFGKYLLGVEIASMLLLAGLVGAYHLGKKEVDSTEVRDDRRARVARSRPGGDAVPLGTGRRPGPA